LLIASYSMRAKALSGARAAPHMWHILDAGSHRSDKENMPQGGIGVLAFRGHGGATHEHLGAVHHIWKLSHEPWLNPQ